jgi:glycosyltransferase involved in cell wall biosynthesis
MKIVLLTTDNREDRQEYECETPWFGTAPEALLQGFAKLPDVEVHVVSCAQRPMKSPAKLAETIFFHSLHVPKIGWLRTGYQGCIRAVRRKLREIRPDIVHGQGTERDCGVCAIFSGYPNVLTIHGNMRLVARVNRARPFTYPWFAARLEHFTIPRSDGVVCITNYTREAVASLARKTWVVPNAVDSSFFEIKRQPASSVRILCVATVDGRKNQNALIRAVDTLRPQGKFELLFLGAANRDTAYAREFFELLETRPWCRYAGFADRNALRQHLASASGLVLPSLEDNCPMVILEAMAAGVPVAAARVGGVPDLVRHGETGLLFDPLSEHAMAAAMKELVENHEPSMAARAQGEAQKRFHPEIIAARHVEIYREILEAVRR